MTSTFLSILTAIAKNHLGFAPHPRFVTFIVTYRCNLNCVMCNIPSLATGKELDAQEIDSILSKLGRLDAMRISGGEPFIRKDIAKLMRSINKHNNPHMLTVSTNGILTDRILKTLQELNFLSKLHVEISLDGVGEYHDAIRRRKGAYEQSMETVRQLSEFREKSRLSVHVSQVIVDDKGFDAYFELVDVLHPLGVDIHPIIAYDAKTALYSGQTCITDPTEVYDYDDAFKAKLKDFLSVLLKRNSDRRLATGLVKRYYLMGIYHRVLLNSKKPNPKCTALHNHMRINPDGRVPVCLHNSNVVGNLTEKEVNDLWHNPDIQPSRKWVRNCPGCWAGCEVIPSAVYSGDILKAFRYRNP